MPKINAAKQFRARFGEELISATYHKKVAGARAIGLDRVDGKNFAGKSASEITLISQKVLAGNYRFTKYKEKLISKGAGKSPRRLSIPTIRDRLTLKILSDFLFEIFPESKPTLPQDKIDLLRKEIGSGKYSHFIKLDLKDFYPSINHKLLLSKLRKKIRIVEFRTLVEHSLQTPTVPENNTASGSLNLLGVPQGLSVSNVLAEVFMTDIDTALREVAPVCVRFVDDIVLLTHSDPQVVLTQAISVLKRAKLNPHPPGAIGSKTRIGQLSEGFDFLGYSMLPNSVSVRRNSIESFEGSLVAVFTDYKHRLRLAKNADEREAAMRRFRWALNLKLTGCIYKNQRFGWVFYYSQISDLSVLRRIDNTVKHLLKRFRIETPPNPKRMLKTFYESKRIDKDSHWYIPNYDNMTAERMRHFLKEIGYNVDGFPDVEVSIAFHKLIRRATRSLEQDVANLS